MCKTVYLTSKRFDYASRYFCNLLKKELQKRNIDVVFKKNNDIFNIFRKRKVYGIALGFDFYNDGKNGSGLTLNKRCSNIGRQFAYSLSNGIDSIYPDIIWRDILFVDSKEKTWFKNFNKVSATTKAIFHLCTKNNEYEYEVFITYEERLVKVFADEIVRCLRSNYDTGNYMQRIQFARYKQQKRKVDGNK